MLWSHDECVRYPLVLTNVDGQFIPLVRGDGSTDMPSALDIVPLVTAQLEPVRVWFLRDDEEPEVFSLMQRYMNVTEVNLTQAESISMVLSARLKYQQLEGTVSGAVTRPTVTSQSATVRFRDTFPTGSAHIHSPQTLPTEWFNGGTQQSGTVVIN